MLNFGDREVHSVGDVASDSGVLFQEELWRDPFWMLVGCILLNRAHWHQVDPVLRSLRARCKDAKGLLRASMKDVLEIVKPLGMHNRRLSLLRRFALSWVDHPPSSSSDVAKMPGCGEYAVQSYMIFVEGKMPPLDQITDPELARYVRRRKGL